jgi:hypothetical protein
MQYALVLFIASLISLLFTTTKPVSEQAVFKSRQLADVPEQTIVPGAIVFLGGYFILKKVKNDHMKK